MMLNEPVTVNSRKYDLSIRRSWECRFLEQVGTRLTFVGEFDSLIEHPELGEIAKGTISYEYYWLDRWYNIFRFLEPNGELRNFYCNVSMPASYSNGVLDYVDLDIDIVIWPDDRIITLDEFDFTANTLKYNYPDDVVKNARAAIDDLHRMVDNREYPF